MMETCIAPPAGKRMRKFVKNAEGKKNKMMMENGFAPTVEKRNKERKKKSEEMIVYMTGFVHFVAQN